MRSSALIVLLVLCAVPVGAVDIQYTLGTLDVITANDTPIESAAGYGIVTLVDVLAADIVWPIPTGSPEASTCGTGRAEWSRLTNPNGTTIAELGLIIRPDLLWFHTDSTFLAGCHQVSTWGQLRTLYRAAWRAAFLTNNKEFLDVLNDTQVMVMRRCPGTGGGTNCDTARANALTLDSEYPGSGVTATFTTEAVKLQQDVNAFKNSACANQPGGPFC